MRQKGKLVGWWEFGSSEKQRKKRVQQVDTTAKKSNT